MVVDEARARAAGLVHEHGGQVHFFCSEQCRKTFAAQPEAKQTKTGGEAPPPAHEHHGEHGAAPAARQASL
jgi:YHS domain-containing protein